MVPIVRFYWDGADVNVMFYCDGADVNASFQWM